MEFFKKRTIIVTRRKLSHLGLKSPKVECVEGVGGEVGWRAGAGGGVRYRFFGVRFVAVKTSV